MKIIKTMSEIIEIVRHEIDRHFEQKKLLNNYFDKCVSFSFNFGLLKSVYKHPLTGSKTKIELIFINILLKITSF